MSNLTYDRIMEDLAGVLSNFHGREYGGRITPETWFSADLGLASIDAVVLGETLEEHYQRPIPFNRFLSELGARQVRDVRIGELADFLHRELNHA